MPAINWRGVCNILSARFAIFQQYRGIVYRKKIPFYDRAHVVYSIHYGPKKHDTVALREIFLTREYNFEDLFIDQYWLRPYLMA